MPKRLLGKPWFSRNMFFQLTQVSGVKKGVKVGVVRTANT